LLAGGAYCVRVARAVDRKLMALAVIPLLFGIQQLCEGWVWVGLAISSHALTIAGATAFLFFALLVWPVWIPLSTLFTERSRNKQIYRVSRSRNARVVGLPA
jgi:heme A synthase